MFFKKLFKQKKPDKETKKFFDALNSVHFPGGDKQIKKYTNQIIDILGNKIDYDEARGILFVAKAMLSINQGRVPEMIEKKISIPITKNELIKLVTFITFNDISDSHIELATQGYNLLDVGFSDDEIPFGTGEFGKCNSNPIPIKGIMSSKSYLERLSTTDGKEIESKRIKSEEPGIQQIVGLVDVYQITDKDKKDLGKLYISPYNQKKSNKAPTGFVIKDGYVVNSDEDLQRKVNIAQKYKQGDKLIEALGVYNQIYDYICAESAKFARSKEGSREIDEDTVKILPQYFSYAEKYMKQDDLACKIANNMGTIFAELGDFTNAKKMFEDSIRCTPDNLDYSDPKIGLQNLKQ